MKRFNCPNCGRSLFFRLLPHVPRRDGQFAFSCTHCGAVLTYTDAHVPLGTPLWGTKLRSLATFLVGMVLLWGIARLGGRVAALTVLAVAVAIYVAAYLFSPAPAYDVVNRGHPGDGAQP